MIGAIFPGLIMLVIAAVLATVSGLLLGYAKARSELAKQMGLGQGGRKPARAATRAKK